MHAPEPLVPGLLLCTRGWFKFRRDCLLSRAWGRTGSGKPGGRAFSLSSCCSSRLRVHCTWAVGGQILWMHVQAWAHMH